MHMVVSITNDINIAEFLGKKGTEGNINFYNRTIEDNVLVSLFPQNIEKNIIPLAEAMLISDIIIISTLNLDKLFGEIVIAASLLDKHIIFTDDNDIKKFITELNINNFEITSKNELLNKILNYKPNLDYSSARIDIDRAFPVKGVGTVALGIVTKGIINVHDNLYHSNNDMVSVRTLQVHDVDVEKVTPKMRVGISLKGISYDQINSGDLLTSSKIQKVKEINTKIKSNLLTSNMLGKDIPYTLVSNFMHVNANLIKDENNIKSFLLNKECALDKGDRFLLIQNKVPRIIASGTII
ncbi:MAG: EF-Tu/IF-2/RF-3 family GTPase [Candidatus Micrarchaeia archaeon]